MSRKIILFGPLPPPYGGVAVYMQALRERFRSSNVRVWTYATTGPIPADVRFIAHRRLATLWALLTEGRGARILDASHFHLEYPNALLLTIWIVLKKLLGFEWYKNVLDGSLPKRYPQFGGFQRWLFHRAANAVDHFVVVSEELRRWLSEEMNMKQPITVIPCLLPPRLRERPQPLSPELSEFLQPYFAAYKRVCSIGVFYPSYGFREVALAVEQLRERIGKNIALILLDGGFVLDEKYRNEVLWDRDWITVLEKISNPEIYEILKGSDVFVRAFADESYGISRIEALWCGTPVIATRAGETRGMLLYDAGNVDQLADQLQALLLYPVLEEPNPWAERYRVEAEQNLQAIARVLGLSASHLSTSALSGK